MGFGIEIALGACLIFLLRVASAALATLRALVMARGAELWSAVLGFFEVLIYVVAVGLVVSDLSNIPALFGYCLGFSVGTVLGMRIEQRLALGVFTLRIISRFRAGEVAAGLRDAGFGATLNWAEGRDGRVGIVHVVLPRRRAPLATSLARSVDPGAFVVAEESRTVSAGWISPKLGNLRGEQK